MVYESFEVMIVSSDSGKRLVRECGLKYEEYEYHYSVDTTQDGYAEFLKKYTEETKPVSFIYD